LAIGLLAAELGGDRGWPVLLAIVGTVVAALRCPRLPGLESQAGDLTTTDAGAIEEEEVGGVAPLVEALPPAVLSSRSRSPSEMTGTGSMGTRGVCIFSIAFRTARASVGTPCSRRCAIGPSRAWR
jgi:hypothetical protein